MPSDVANCLLPYTQLWQLLCWSATYPSAGLPVIMAASLLLMIIWSKMFIWSSALLIKIALFVKHTTGEFVVVGCCTGL